VQPLVDDLNNLIEVNAQMVLRARAQAGNLAHALKTPLAVLTDEAYRLETEAKARRQRSFCNNLNVCSGKSIIRSHARAPPLRVRYLGCSHPFSPQ